MGYDPLSRATRTTRTSLITFCAIFLSIDLFKLEEKNFEVLGVPIPDNFLPVALSIGIVLLSISFALYAYDDVRSRETRAQNQVELQKINDRIKTLDEMIKKHDDYIKHMHQAYQLDLDKRTWMRPSDTAELEDLKYDASKYLAERRDLGARKMKLESAIEAPSSNPLSSARFWLIELGVPIVALVLVGLGWLERLKWLRDYLNIVPATP